MWTKQICAGGFSYGCTDYLQRAGSGGVTAATQNPPWGRIIATLACLALLPICFSIAGSLYADFPSYVEWACGESSASGCVEWSLVTVGPLYILYAMVYFTFVTGMTLLPLLLLPVIWLRGRKQKPISPSADNIAAQVEAALPDLAATAPVKKTYHNLTVVDSSVKAQPVPRAATAKQIETKVDEAENVSIRAAIKGIFNRTDSND